MHDWRRKLNHHNWRSVKVNDQWIGLPAVCLAPHDSITQERVHHPFLSLLKDLNHWVPPKPKEYICQFWCSDSYCCIMHSSKPAQNSDKLTFKPPLGGQTSAKPCGKNTLLLESRGRLSAWQNYSSLNQKDFVQISIIAEQFQSQIGWNNADF